MTQADPVVTSLEIAATLCDDLSGPVYARHASTAPDAHGLMSHMDTYMRGRMLNDLLALLMTEPEEIDPGYLNFEVHSHQAYGVTPAMFRPLLECARDAVADLLGERWTPSMKTAWDGRISALDGRIAQAAET